MSRNVARQGMFMKTSTRLVAIAILSLVACSRTNSDDVVRLSRDDAYASGLEARKFVLWGKAPTDEGPEVGGQCNVEGLNGLPISAATVQVRRNAELAVTGWAFDSSGRAAPRKLAVVLLSEEHDTRQRRRFGAAVTKSYSRPDVLRAFGVSGDPSALGFGLRTLMSDVPPGHYEVLLQFDGRSGVLECHSGMQLDILP